MKIINITPAVIKLEKKLLKEKNLKVAGYMIDQAFGKEQIEVFREDGTKLFWFENHGAAKYAVRFLTSHITKYMKLEYRDKKCVEDTGKAVKTEVTKPESEPQEDLKRIVDPEALQKFAKDYMGGYKIPAEFKKKDLSEKETSRMFKEFGENFTGGVEKFVNKIYGGKKADFHSKNRMSSEERKEYELNNRQEFSWYLDTLTWLANPSEEYLKQFGKFKTSNYLKITGDLRSVVVNSLVHYRTFKAF